MSTLFNLKLPQEPKPISRHPWANTIKDIFSHRIKHAHNSVRNPLYPKSKERIPDAERTRFTIIGDRITKEFIYCVNLVKGLHKYRWKKFDVPSIRAVNTVEWEDVLRSLKVQYGGLAHCLNSKVAVLVNDKLLGGEVELKELVESRYIYHLIIDYCSEAVAGFASYIRCSGRACAYMHIAINDEHIGTLIFMLYSDILPYTCENFLRLCKETKGGYSGTPIHRIVKDGWIQCGGFGLKNTDLDCENFSVPHDRRGVLCMANDGRNVDCSTQFFVTLQPTPWMAYKYVAFGQLIEGDATLKKIESVPTWYESPTSNIIIYKAGIFNMECHDFMINKGTNEYIQGHIEDLNALGDLLIEALIERVHLEIELRMVERLRKELLGEDEEETEEERGDMRATKRFIRKKEEIEKQIQSQPKMSTHKASISSPMVKPSQSIKSQVMQSQSMKSQMLSEENNEFDVEEYEPEETDYQNLSIAATLSLIKKPEIPYYIPLTDVPYPGEIDSVYDLKKFLKGHYCLESDLEREVTDTTKISRRKSAFPSEIFLSLHYDVGAESDSIQSLDSNDEREIRQYLKLYVDQVSFGGEVIKSIAKADDKINLLEASRKSKFTDDELRRIRMAFADYKKREFHEKKVSIGLPSTQKQTHKKIKRRQTGFVRPEDLEKIHIFQKSTTEFTEDDDDDSGPRKVRIAPSALAQPTSPRPQRRPTGFVSPHDVIDSESDMVMTRQSVLQRLYDDVTYDDDAGPTLKDYKPFLEAHQKSILLTYSPNSRMKSEEDTHRFLRLSIQADDNMSYENVLNLQHSKKIARKISSDYVNTIDQMEHRTENSLRSHEFAKRRPSMSVAEYQLKYQEAAKALIAGTCRPPGTMKGLRLPGDTPLYSMCEGLKNL